MFDRVAEGRWWDLPWSLVDGCTPCSPGCDHCWLRAMDRRFRRGGSVTFRRDRLALPELTKRLTAWAVWSDLFHPDVPEQQICNALYMADRCTRKHVFMVLTKRPERMAKLASHLGGWPRTVWAGVTVCNQAEADEKIPLLLQVPAAVRFLSIEPMLGPVDLSPWMVPHLPVTDDLEDAPDGAIVDGLERIGERWGRVEHLHWVILGGETGPGARPALPDWVRSVRDECQAAGVPFFFKQWGEWAENPGWSGKDEDPIFQMRRVGRKRAGRVLDGRTWDELPGHKTLHLRTDGAK